jgi:hypothetical protein
VGKLGSRARRSLVVTVGVAALGVTGLAVNPGSAQASGGGASHFCDEFAPADDGGLTDVLHHTIEPIAPVVHASSCRLQASLEPVSCIPGLAFLGSPTYAFRPFTCQAVPAGP